MEVHGMGTNRRGLALILASPRQLCTQALISEVKHFFIPVVITIVNRHDIQHSKDKGLSICHCNSTHRPASKHAIAEYAQSVLTLTYQLAQQTEKVQNTILFADRGKTKQSLEYAFGTYCQSLLTLG